MQIRTTVRLQSGIYHAEVMLGLDNPISAVEQTAINQFGPLAIEVGGEVVAPGATVTLPLRTISIPGGLPEKQTFALTDYSDNAEDLAHAWTGLIEGRIAVALDTLLKKDAGVTGTVERNVLPVPGDSQPADLQTSEWMNLT